MKNSIDPEFDGHLEKSIKDMTPDERLDFLWRQIEFRNYIKKGRIAKIGKNALEETEV